MVLNYVKLGCTVSFIKYLAGVVSLIFQPKSLIRNIITFRALNSLNLLELTEN